MIKRQMNSLVGGGGVRSVVVTVDLVVGVVAVVVVVVVVVVVDGVGIGVVPGLVGIVGGYKRIK